MRQAGRYLPEYKELRSRSKSFLDFCYTPDMASEATLQPIRRFSMDGAIIFSDILVIPHAMGVEVRFEEGKGPLLTPILTDEALSKLRFDMDKLAPVYQALELTRKALPEETALIGFAGAPWTLACYIIQGKGSRDFQDVRSMTLRQPEFFSGLMRQLEEAVASHAIRQIDSGAEVIQLFDSWAGVLGESQFHQFVAEPAARIVQAIRQRHPQVPIIGFPRMAGEKYLHYAQLTKVDAVSIDGSVSLEWAARELPCVIQGNLDPVMLAENAGAMMNEAKRIVSLLGDKSFVFNLGHGILPHTPISNVQLLCDFLKGLAPAP